MSRSGASAAAALWLDEHVTPLADPHRCPSCRGDLPSDLVCASCGLDLRGDLGMRLFGVLTQADALIATIRTRTVVPAATGAGTTVSAPVHMPLGPPDIGSLPTYPAPATRIADKVGLGAVPKVLLGLGALCVLGAASLFLPFAWSMLGIVGRTVVLILLTVAGGAAAHAAGSRGLRATAESLGAVMLGLVALDVLGARTSGWLGEISDPAVTVLLGAVLVAAATAATLWLRGTAVASFVAGELVAILGGVLLLLGGASLDLGSAGQRLSVVVPVLGAVAVGSAVLRRPRTGVDSMATATIGHTAMAATAWLGMVLAGAEGIVDRASYAEMWPGGAGLTLLLAGAYAALPGLVRRLSPALRATSIAAALLPWAVAATAPSYDESATGRILAVSAPLALCILLVHLLPRPWSRVGVPTALVSALATAALGAPLAVTAVATYLETALPSQPGGGVGRVVPWWGADSLGTPWLLPLVVIVLVVGALVLGREWAEESALLMQTLLLIGGVMTVLAVAGALLIEGAPVWWVLVLLLAATFAASAAAWFDGRDARHLAQVVLGAAALVLSWHDEWLTLAASLFLLVLAAAHHGRGAPPVRVGGGLTMALLLAASLWTAGELLQVPGAWNALVVLLVGGALVIARGLLAARQGIIGVELGATVAAAAALTAGVDRAPWQDDQTWLAIYLTVAGVAVTVVALTRADRRLAGWVGGLLLAVATWVRLAEIGVEEPEPYTLPSAAALLVAGWFRTRRNPGAGTLSAWGPGLCLALVPSLLWAIAEPLSWRAVLLGGACLVLTVVGAQLRLAGPFVWGASIGAVLVLWEIVPRAFELSAWLSMGMVGAGLLALGASWEQRVRDARAAIGYVRGLR